jgi:heat shock protein HslJ
MKRNLLFPLLIILIAAACSLPAALATKTPAVPVTSPVVTQLPSSTGNPSALIGTSWLWVGFTSPNDQVAVETPANYSLAFQQDGTVSITADCNSGTGTYQADTQSIKIQPGTLTRAACPAGSRSDEFIQYVGNAASYTFQDGSLFIDLASEAGTLVLAPSEQVKADQGGDAMRTALQSNPWQWVSFASAAGQYNLENPGNYQLTFHDNGTVDIKADCNNASGTYTIDGIKISILVGPATLVACPAGSRGEEFFKDLGSAATYFYQPGEFFLDLSAEGGTLRFTPIAGQ